MSICTMTPKKHVVPKELLSSLLAHDKKPEDLIGENGLLKQLTKLLVEKALDAEFTEHLGHNRHETVADANGNTRNGKSRKTLRGDFGELPIEVPRDRCGTFEPQLIPKHPTRLAGFDDKIISLYARGMAAHEIQDHLEETYVSHPGRSYGRLGNKCGCSWYQFFMACMGVLLLSADWGSWWLYRAT